MRWWRCRRIPIQPIHPQFLWQNSQRNNCVSEYRPAIYHIGRRVHWWKWREPNWCPSWNQINTVQAQSPHMIYTYVSHIYVNEPFARWNDVSHGIYHGVGVVGCNNHTDFSDDSGMGFPRIHWATTPDWHGCDLRHSGPNKREGKWITMESYLQNHLISI